MGIGLRGAEGLELTGDGNVSAASRLRCSNTSDALRPISTALEPWPSVADPMPLRVFGPSLLFSSSALKPAWLSRAIGAPVVIFEEVCGWDVASLGTAS